MIAGAWATSPTVISKLCEALNPSGSVTVTVTGYGVAEPCVKPGVQAKVAVPSWLSVSVAPAGTVPPNTSALTGPSSVAVIVNCRSTPSFTVRLPGLVSTGARFAAGESRRPPVMAGAVVVWLGTSVNMS